MYYSNNFHIVKPYSPANLQKSFPKLFMSTPLVQDRSTARVFFTTSGGTVEWEDDPTYSPTWPSMMVVRDAIREYCTILRSAHVGGKKKKRYVDDLYLEWSCKWVRGLHTVMLPDYHAWHLGCAPYVFFSMMSQRYLPYQVGKETNMSSPCRKSAKLSLTLASRRLIKHLKGWKLWSSASWFATNWCVLDDVIGHVHIISGHDVD